MTSAIPPDCGALVTGKVQSPALLGSESDAHNAPNVQQQNGAQFPAEEKHKESIGRENTVPEQFAGLAEMQNYIQTIVEDVRLVKKQLETGSDKGLVEKLQREHVILHTESFPI